MSLVTCVSALHSAHPNIHRVDEEGGDIFWSRDSDAMSMLDCEQSGSCSV